MSLLLQKQNRPRIGYLFAVLVTIAAGLASRRFPGLLPPCLGKYPGDALWALMLFFAWGIFFQRAPALRIAALTLIACYAIEFLKLSQSPGWSHIRHTTVGHLIFGQAFNWQNLIAYAIGVAFGLICEAVIAHKRTSVPSG